MNKHRVSPEISLRQGLPIRLMDAAGMRVRCLRGTIWITVASEPEDVFLGTGQSYLIPRNGLSLIERIGNDSVQLELSGPGGWFNGLLRHLRNGPATKISRTGQAASAPGFRA